MLTLNNIKSPKGAIRNTKRIGRGQGSGWGCQAGKGHKGQVKGWLIIFHFAQRKFPLNEVGGDLR